MKALNCSLAPLLAGKGQKGFVLFAYQQKSEDIRR